MMKEIKKIVIIGAGITGLLSGLEFSKKGYDVTILEKNKFIGGVATSIISNGYKLYSKNFINIIDPYIMLFNYKITNDNRFYGTFTIAFIYFLVVSIVLFYRFQKKIE